MRKVQQVLVSGVAAIAIIVLTAGSVGAAATSESIADPRGDAPAVDGAAADVVGASVAQDDGTATTTFTVTLAPTTAFDVTFFVAAKQGSGATRSVTFELGSNATQALAGLAVLSSDPSCQQTGVKPSSSQLVDVTHDGRGDATVTWSVKTSDLGATSFDWAVLATEPTSAPPAVAWDYAPEAVNPDASASNPGDRSCTTGGASAGVRLAMDSGVAFPQATTAPPVARFAATPDSPYDGDLTTLDSQSGAPAGRVVATTWEYEPGNTFADASGASVQTRFAAGAHDVGLQVIDDHGQSATARRTIVARTRGLLANNVSALLDAWHEDAYAPPVFEDAPIAATLPPAPTVRIHARPRRPRAGALVTLTAAATAARAGGRIIGLRWDLGGGDTFADAYGRRVRMAFATAGSHRIGVQVLDAHGDVQVKRLTLHVSGSLPQAVTPRLLARRPLRAPDPALRRGLRGWAIRGSAFRGALRRTLTMPLARELQTASRLGGSYADAGEPTNAGARSWISSFRSGARLPGLTKDSAPDAASGVLLSPRLRIAARYLTYRLGGRPDGRLERVELWARRAGGTFRRVSRLTRTPLGTEALQPVRLDVRLLHGAQAVLVAVDDSPLGHLNLADISPATAPRYVAPPPVVGFADAHTHIFAHQGFGGLQGIRTYMGVPGRDYALYTTAAGRLAYDDDVHRDNDTHEGGPVARLVVDILDHLIASPDLFNGLGTVLGTFGHSSATGPAHEQYHVTELHRAWEGGLRVVSSLAVTNPALETLMGWPRRFDGAGPETDFFGAPTERDGPQRSVNKIAVTPDRDAIQAMVEGARQLAAANSDWLAIAYDPQQAYDIAASGRLALVLGVEVDTLGNLGFPSIGDEVDWLWRIGIRQVTMIHAIDNSLGAAAIFQDGYNTENDLVHRPQFDAVGRRVGDDVGAQGLAISPRPGFTGTPQFGYFFGVEGYGCGQPAGPPRGECVTYRLSEHQNIFGIEGDLGAVHQSGRDYDVPAYHAIPGDGPNDNGEHLADGKIATGGMRNANGLTDDGRAYVRALMAHGMLIDIEHESDHSIDALFADGGPLWGGHTPCALTTSAPDRCFDALYPVLSSHTSFRAQSFQSGITNKNYGAREFERTPTQVEYIRRSGGIVSPVVLQDPVDSILDARAPAGTTAPDWRFIGGFDRALTSHPANDCASSSKSWAQAYLYAVEKMHGRGVALADDASLVGGTLPRYLDYDPGDLFGPGEIPAGGAACAAAGTDASGPVSSQSVTQPDSQRIRYVAPTATPHGGELRIDLRPTVFRGDHPDYWNYNVGGMTTIGQLPDMLQDVRNIGVTESDLSPLLHSANDYIDMWRKADSYYGCGDPQIAPDRCDTFSPLPLDAGAVCNGTCPDDPRRGLSDTPPPNVPYRLDGDQSPTRHWKEAFRPQ